MISTANYILLVTLGGVQHVYQNETARDIWSALQDFYFEDYPDLIEEEDIGIFPIDIMAMDGNEVVKTERLAFSNICFDHFYVKGWKADGIYTLNDFYKDLLTTRAEIEERKKNDVTRFMFYMWNRWCEEECKEVFGKDDFYPHFWNKWCGICKMLGTAHGAAEMFYAELSDRNRDKLVRRAVEYYNEQNH